MKLVTVQPVQLRPAICSVALMSLLLAPVTRADVIPFVDNYKTNVSGNASPDTNAAINLLAGFSSLWSTGTAWNTNIAKYNDVGTGAGLTNSPTVGQIVSLVATLRGNFSSTTPAKNYFNSPRPWRLTDDIRVVDQGTESIGYYTNDLSDGTPDFTAGLTFFPLYQTRVVIPPTLMAVRSTTPASDGSTARDAVALP